MSFNDYMDKETKQAFLLIIGIFLFLLIVYPLVNFQELDFSNPLSKVTDSVDQLPGGSNSTATVELQEGVDYGAVVETSEGSFTIDLFEDNAPQNVRNFIAQIPKYDSADITVQKDFLFSIEATREPSYNIPDEINANSLGLDTRTVEESDFLKELYEPGDSSTEQFAPDNLEKYGDFTLKEFYTEVLGYKYTTDVTTRSATKYMVYMANDGPRTNKADFFILMASNAPQIDGMFTPIGQVNDGFNVLDDINENSGNLEVTSVKVKIL